MSAGSPEMSISCGIGSAKNKLTGKGVHNLRNVH